MNHKEELGPADAGTLAGRDESAEKRRLSSVASYLAGRLPIIITIGVLLTGAAALWNRLDRIEDNLKDRVDHIGVRIDNLDNKVDVDFSLLHSEDREQRADLRLLRSEIQNLRSDILAELRALRSREGS